jgi:hypothetical protein
MLAYSDSYTTVMLVNDLVTSAATNYENTCFNPTCLKSESLKVRTVCQPYYKRFWYSLTNFKSFIVKTCSQYVIPVCQSIAKILLFVYIVHFAQVYEIDRRFTKSIELHRIIYSRPTTSKPAQSLRHSSRCLSARLSIMSLTRVNDRILSHASRQAGSDPSLLKRRSFNFRFQSSPYRTIPADEFRGHGDERKMELNCDHYIIVFYWRV